MAYLNAKLIAGAAGPGAEAPSRLLSELQNTHGALVAGMVEMDLVTDKPVLDRYRQSSARWRLSQTGLRWSILMGNISSHLLPRVAPRESLAVRWAQSAHLELLRASSSHIAKWPADKIQADWAAYRADYRAFRLKLAACVAGEKRILYPLLTMESFSADRD